MADQSRLCRRWIAVFPGILLTLGSLVDSSFAQNAAGASWIANGRSAMVAADSPYASQAGLEILRAGGNAIDAAVAVSFALGVTRPYSTGLGGGGFLIARFADGRIVVRDFRETAPAAATADLFKRARAAKPGGADPSVYGHLAVAVPGLLAGWSQVLSEFGTLPLERVIAPAIRLAREGFAVDNHYVEATEDVSEVYKKHPSLRKSCSYVYQTHLRGGRLRNAGEILIQPELAGLLEGIAKNGPKFFYQGPVAMAIARQMSAYGGLVTESDLAGFKVVQRQPLLAHYGNYELIAMPPPSSGGITLIETLNILDALNWSTIVRDDRDLACHFQVEAMKHAFADRARWLADNDFVPVPTTWLTSPDYAKRLAGLILPNECMPAVRCGSRQLPDDAGTSHFCIVDSFGTAVVATETINTSFGSLAAVAEWGLILNNEMDDFSTEAAGPNEYGLIQSDRNEIAPGKRPLSSMAPTIVVKDNTPYLLLGGSGGPRIISSVLNVFLGVVVKDLSLEAAMKAPRPHHQWSPNLLFFDQDPPENLLRSLRQRGHEISTKRRTGCVQAILRTKEGWVGASDPRKGGRPAGF